MNMRVILILATKAHRAMQSDWRAPLCLWRLRGEQWGGR